MYYLGVHIDTAQYIYHKRYDAKKKLENGDLYFKEVETVSFESKAILKLSINGISLFWGSFKELKHVFC